MLQIQIIYNDKLFITYRNLLRKILSPRINQISQPDITGNTKTAKSG